LVCKPPEGKSRYNGFFIDTYRHAQEANQVKRALAILVLVFFMKNTMAQTQSTFWDSGTVNILLANHNGIVLVTDSRGTTTLPGGSQTHSDRSQKLFQLDGRTVCSIAGFGSALGPIIARRVADLQLATGGAIRALREELTDAKIPKGFDFKARLVADSMAMLLGSLAIENAYASGSESIDLKSLELQILTAGYDLDGTPKIAKSVITVRPRGNLFEGNVTELDIQSIGSGIDDSVDARLKYPDKFTHEPQLATYEKALSENKAGDLNVQQLEDLADYLEGDASKTYSKYIGGPTQKAILKDKSVDLHLPNDLIALPQPRVTRVLAGETSEGAFLYLDNPQHLGTAFINFRCINSGLLLDRSVLIGGSYENCNFYFNGREFYRDKNVSIISGRLIYGPSLTADDYRVKDAMRQLPELSPAPASSLIFGHRFDGILWSEPPAK
jgi:20S proteasome alpha/beta subunit